MAHKLHIPSADPIAELAAGNTNKAVKDAGAAPSTKLYRVPVDKIKLIPGFNVRVDSEDYLAHRDQIAASIRANGYDESKPITGYVAKEGDNNVIYVTDGHTRLDAVAVFNADPDLATEDEIRALPVLVRETPPSMADLTVALHTSNTGRPLTPFELGIVVKRLLAEEGADKAEIAERLTVTPRYLDDVLLLADAQPKVRTHILTGAVSSTFVVQELRRNASEAAGRIEAAVKKAAASGKKRATAKHVGPKVKSASNTLGFAVGDDMKELVKLVAAHIRNMIPNSENGDIKLADSNGTIKLVVGVEVAPKPKVKKAPAKKKAATPPEVEADAAKPPKRRRKKAEPAAAEDDLGIPGAALVGDGDLDLPPPPATSTGI